MYTPGELPTDSIESLQAALNNELQKIAESLKIGEFEAINLKELNRALDKIRNGDIINADGVNYDPGEGQGIYHYDGTTLIKLG